MRRDAFDDATCAVASAAFAGLAASASAGTAAAVVAAAACVTVAAKVAFVLCVAAGAAVATLVFGAVPSVATTTAASTSTMTASRRSNRLTRSGMPTRARLLPNLRCRPVSRSCLLRRSARSSAMKPGQRLRSGATRRFASFRSARASAGRSSTGALPGRFRACRPPPTALVAALARQPS